MKYFDWNEKKNQFLKKTRNIGFEDVLVALKEDRLLTVIKHPNTKRYPNQEILIVDINSYAYLVPFAEDKEKIFLKTIFPSRKYTKKFIG